MYFQRKFMLRIHFTAHVVILSSKSLMRSFSESPLKLFCFTAQKNGRVEDEQRQMKRRGQAV